MGNIGSGESRCGTDTQWDSTSKKCIGILPPSGPTVTCGTGTHMDTATSECLPTLSASVCGTGTHMDTATSKCLPTLSDNVCGRGLKFDTSTNKCEISVYNDASCAAAQGVDSADIMYNGHCPNTNVYYCGQNSKGNNVGICDGVWQCPDNNGLKDNACLVPGDYVMSNGTTCPKGFSAASTQADCSAASTALKIPLATDVPTASQVGGEAWVFSNEDWGSGCFEDNTKGKLYFNAKTGSSGPIATTKPHQLSVCKKDAS